MFVKMFGVVLAALFLFGCATGKEAVKSASHKNVNAEGFLMLGKIETSNPETGTPIGEIVTGRISYKSRLVGIAADQKVPDTGSYKRTKTKSLFGTEEDITEFDFTASSNEQANKMIDAFQKQIDKDSASTAGKEAGGEDKKEATN